MTEQDAIALWEDSTEDADEAPTNEDLLAFAKAVEDRVLEDAALDWPQHQAAHMGKGTVKQIANWLRERKNSDG